MQIYWIWLAHRPGLSNRIKRQLMERFASAEDLYYAQEDAIAGIPGLTRDARASLGDKNLESARKILEDCSRKQIQLLTWQDGSYPARLRHIPDPPMVLYCKGQLPQMEDTAVIGIVGTRRASAYGLKTARQMGSQIAACGAVVVSGLAGGIDAMAMSGALAAGQQVVGVLGCGVDIVYPAANRKLFREVETAGCIFSEFPPGTPPLGSNFPRRNRIISGMGDGVLVVEAPERSGALITARLALEQGRDVFVVPGNIDQPGFAGSNQLLQDGAALVASGWEVLREYQSRYPDKLCQRILEEEKLPEQPGKTEKSPQMPHLNKKLEKKPIDKSPDRLYSDVNAMLRSLPPEDQAILRALADGPRLADELTELTGLSAGIISVRLTMLEIKGAIDRLPGRRVSLKN